MFTRVSLGLGVVISLIICLNVGLVFLLLPHAGLCPLLRDPWDFVGAGSGPVGRGEALDLNSARGLPQRRVLPRRGGCEPHDHGDRAAGPVASLTEGLDSPKVQLEIVANHSTTVIEMSAPILPRRAGDRCKPQHHGDRADGHDARRVCCD